MTTARPLRKLGSQAVGVRRRLRKATTCTLLEEQICDEAFIRPTVALLFPRTVPHGSTLVGTYTPVPSKAGNLSLQGSQRARCGSLLILNSRRRFVHRVSKMISPITHEWNHARRGRGVDQQSNPPFGPNHVVFEYKPRIVEHVDDHSRGQQAGSNFSQKGRRKRQESGKEGFRLSKLNPLDEEHTPRLPIVAFSEPPFDTNAKLNRTKKQRGRPFLTLRKRYLQTLIFDGQQGYLSCIRCARTR